MRFARVVAVLALLGLAASARADVIEEPVHRSTAGVVLRDTVGGGLVGSAVAGGIILYNMGIQNDSNYNWGRTLAWGALVGLGAGLVLGVVDASTGAFGMMSPTPTHDGMSSTLDLHARDQANAQIFPIVLHGF